MMDIETLANAFDQIQQETPYAIAKAHDVIANIQRGGDIDIIVGDVAAARQTLVRLFGEPRRESVSSYAHALAFGWGEVDLIDRVHWRGITLVTTERILSGAVVGPDSILVTRPAHEMINACFYPKVSYGFYKSEYQGVLRRAVDTDFAECMWCLTEVLGHKGASQVLSSVDLNDIETRWLRRRLLRNILRDSKEFAAAVGYAAQRVQRPR